MDEVTYGVIYKYFITENPDIVHQIEDYRPEGYNTIRIFFKDGVEICTKFNTISHKFEIVKVESRENSSFLK